MLRPDSKMRRMVREVSENHNYQAKACRNNMAPCDNYVAIVHALVDAGMKNTTYDLECALDIGHPDMVKSIVERDGDAAGHGRRSRIVYGDHAMVRFLIECGTDPNGRFSPEELEKFRRSPDIPDPEPWLTILVAINSAPLEIDKILGLLEMIILLIELGAEKMLKEAGARA